jgi:hypothetical protein
MNTMLRAAALAALVTVSGAAAADVTATTGETKPGESII